MENDEEFKYTIITTGLKAEAYKRMFVDYEEFLNLQLNLYKKEKEEKEKDLVNVDRLSCIINFFIFNSIMTCLSCGIYYLRR